MKLSILVLPALALVGCTSSAVESSQQGDTALTTGSARDACLTRAAANHVDSVTLHGFAVNWPAQTGLANVTVCSQPADGSVPPNCSMTGSDGNIDLTVPPCENVRVTYAFDGYLKVNQLDTVDIADLHIGTRMLTTTQVEHLAAAVGATYDPTKALPIVTTFDAAHHPLADVSIASEAGDGKGTSWYLSASGVPMTSLTATSSFGIMGYFNVDPGTRQVTATAAGKTCVPFASMAGDVANSAVLEALPGSIAEAVFTCN
jgi:hypothetical protein